MLAIKMKYLILIHLLIIALTGIGCESNDPKTISTSATASKNTSGEFVVRDATQSEIDSVRRFHEKIQKINEMYPAPPAPLKGETFVVRAITEKGVFILENNLQVKMSGIKCRPSGVKFLRRFFEEDTERLAYQKENQLSNGVVESYIWLVDSSMMNDSEMKGAITGPSYSSMNDTAILNNWCEIESYGTSKFHSRYVALEKISSKNRR
jgi:hypothetical protein